MDDLLQKLRAAKPEAKDQRDRRRRARLKDRHQVRVASGQKIPELGVNVDDEEGSGDGGKILSPTSEGGESAEGATVTSPIDPTGSDVADRAAAMLEGLQGGPSALNKDGSLSVRRRRENADSERERRRRRRQQASTASNTRSEDGALMSPTTIPEEEGEEFSVRRGSVVSGDGTDDGPSTPITVVHPPSPEAKRDEGKRLPTPPPES
jgi:cytokinesis protein